MTSISWVENETILKDVIFEFVSLYGPSYTWNEEINSIFNEEVERRIKMEE